MIPKNIQYHVSTDLLLPRQNIMKISLTCLNVPGWLNIPLFLWLILILITFWMRLSTNPIHHIETAYDMHQLIDQPTRVDDKTSSVLDVILTSHPVLHRKCAVLKYSLSDHYLIFTHMEFGNNTPSVADLWSFVTWKNSIESLRWSNFIWHS